MSKTHAQVKVTSQRIIHRDIKPENILFNSLNDIKLTDFGFSKQFKIPFRKDVENVGSIPYMAPELLAMKKDYSVTIDLWAVGCIMYKMMTGKFLCPVLKGDIDIKRYGSLENQIKIFGIRSFKESDVLTNYTQREKLEEIKESFGLQVNFKFDFNNRLIGIYILQKQLIYLKSC